jgi:hypothetical protein
MKQTQKILIILGLIFYVGIFCAGAQDTGKENMVLNGGKQGKVNFAHHRHQTIAGECDVCHSAFPSTPDALEQSKADGTLKPKQVMNKICLKCHRDLKKAGEKFGPVTCSGCHVK